MRIFVVSNGYPTKQSPQWGCFERDQAEALAALNHEVVMISYDRRFRWFWRKPGITTIQRNHVTSVNIFLIPNKIVRMLGKRIYQWFKHWQIDCVYKRAVKKFGTPDILYSHFLPVTSNAVFLKQKYGIPLVAMEHWSELAKETIKPGFLRMGKDTYPHVDKLLSVSPFLQEQLYNSFGIKSQIVYNVVGSDFIYTPQVTPNTKIRFISIGSLIPVKRLDVAIDAFASLRLPYDKWEYLIIGDGNERNRLQQYVVDRGLQSNIQLLGRKTKTEIATLLKSSDVFILSSELETFSVVCIEALACGLPIIATTCGGPNSIIRKEDGLLSPVNDVKELANAISYMFEHYREYDRQLIADSCQARFGANSIATQLIEIFEETIKTT